jgi:hypothetical protein
MVVCTGHTKAVREHANNMACSPFQMGGSEVLLFKWIILTWPSTTPQLKQYSVKHVVQAAGKAPPVFFMIAQPKQVGYSESSFWVAI